MLPYHQRKEDLLLNSHLLAYESLVGTLTKQVLAQQEQLTELRQLLAVQHAPSVAGTSFASAIGGSSSPPPLATSTRRGQQPALSVESMSPIFPPHVDDERDARNGSTVDAGARGCILADDATCQKLLRQLEPQIIASIEAHMEAVEQRIAVSLAARIRRITKDHVIASLEREVRRVMRDAVIDANDPQAPVSSQNPAPKPRHAARKSGLGKSKKARASTTADLGGTAEAGNVAPYGRGATMTSVSVPTTRVEPHSTSQQKQQSQQDALLNEMARLRKKLAEVEQAALSRQKHSSSSSSSSRSASSSSAASSAPAPRPLRGRARETAAQHADGSIGSATSLRNVDRDVDELLAKFRLLSHKGGGDGA